jgi:hypothetical protein
MKEVKNKRLKNIFYWDINNIYPCIYIYGNTFYKLCRVQHKIISFKASSFMIVIYHDENFLIFYVQHYCEKNTFEYLRNIFVICMYNKTMF